MRKPVGRAARARERGDHAATGSGEDCRARVPVRPHLWLKGTLSRDTSFDMLGSVLCNVIDRLPILRGGSRALVAVIAQVRVPSAMGPRSCVHNFRQLGASSPHTERTRHEYSAWAPDASGNRVRSHLFGIRSRATEPTARRTGRPALDSSEGSISCSSRDVESCIWSRWECMGDLYGCRDPQDSRCAIAEAEKRRERARAPRIGAVGLARPRHAGA